MKFKREIRIVFLAVMIITLSCPGGFAELNVGDYTLGGYVSVGGGWLSDAPRNMDRGYLKQYIPFPQGFLAETDVELQSKEGLDYYRFRMSHPGLRDQDYLVQVGKIGLFHAEIEFDQLQHLYCTVNPFATSIGILVQRLRFKGYYNLTPEITIFAENDWLRRTGFQAASNNTGPGNPYNFTTFLRPINYNQNDMRAGVEYAQPTEQKSIFQGRMSYHLSTFDNGNPDFLGRQPPVGAATYDSLPGSNMANYVTAEGALNLKSYLTRISGSLSYGWLSQNDQVFDSNTAAGPPPTLAGRYNGLAGLGANTFTADIAGLTRPIDQLALRYSYRAYNYDDNNTGNQILRTAFGDNQSLLQAEHYSYFRQGVNLGADYRVNSMVAVTAGYTWKGDSRTEGQGNTSSHSPQVGIRLSPTDWMNLTANYAYTTRTGSNFLAFVQEAGAVDVPLTYKFNVGNLNRNNFLFIAEVYPTNTVNCSVNFSIYNDNFTDSSFGIQSDRGWSLGADVGWRPHDRVALSLGYDHQQLQTKELATVNPILGETALIVGDEGPTLTTSDSYDTFFARADIKLIPKKLNLTSRASYSFANSIFHNSTMNNLHEYYADINTFLTYRFNEHWACRVGYTYQVFGMSNAYGRMFTVGQLATGAAGADQRFNTLDGFFRNASASVVQGFLQYKF